MSTSQSNKGTLFVVDSNWYLHRAFHTTKTSRDFGTVLIHNFIRMVMKDALAVRATHLILAFDGDKIFRYKVYPAYKANRAASPTSKEDKKGKAPVVSEEDRDEAEELHDIYQYYPQLFETLAALGIAFYQPTKYEADDCLCSCARKFSKKGYKVVCGTQDKDAFQYVAKGVMLYDSSFKDKEGKAAPRYITEKDVIKLKGVKPSQMVEYQMLLGDSIDNLPGISGIGPKTAAARLTEFGTIKNWYENGSKKDKSILRINQAKLILNKKIVTLVDDVYPPFKIEMAVVPKKVKVKFEVPKSYYDYVSFLYPKSKGLASLLGRK